MSMRLRENRLGAFTVTDVLIVVATVAVLGGLAYSGFRPWRMRTVRRTSCASNIKQICLGFAQYVHDNETSFPMSISVTNGGLRETADLLPPSHLFRLLSNFIGHPDVFVCPTDRKRRPATGFTNLTDANLSYFIALDANENRTNTLFCGDRNIAMNGVPVSGVLAVSRNARIGWATNMHNRFGNFGFPDGYTESGDDSVLSNLMASTTAYVTNPFRLSIP